jgi:hypothetical protein
MIKTLRVFYLVISALSLLFLMGCAAHVNTSDPMEETELTTSDEQVLKDLVQNNVAQEKNVAPDLIYEYE